MSTAAANDKIKLTEPDAYDGTPAKFRGFMRQVNVYLAGRKVTEMTKGSRHASYMKHGLAATWAEDYVDMHLPTNNWGTWAAFEVALRATFADKVSKRRHEKRWNTTSRREKELTNI